MNRLSRLSVKWAALVPATFLFWAILGSGGRPDPRLIIRDSRPEAIASGPDRSGKRPVGRSYPPSSSAQATTLYMNQKVTEEFSSAFEDLLVNDFKGKTDRSIPVLNSSGRSPDGAPVKSSISSDSGFARANADRSVNSQSGIPPDLHRSASDTSYTYEELLKEAARCAKSRIWSEAEALCRKAMALKPDRPLAGLLLADTMLRHGSVEEAAGILQQMCAAMPANALIQIALGRVKLQQGKLDDALASCLEAQQLKPDWEMPYQDAGIIYYRKNELERAEASFRQAARLSADSAPPRLGLALIADRKGRIDEARTLYELALERKPDMPLALNNLAYILVRQGKELDKAIQLANKAAELSPMQHSVWDTLGWAQFKAGNKELALRNLQRAIDLAPGLALPCFHQAKVLEALGQQDKAQNKFKAALAKGLPANELREAQAALGQPAH